VRAVNPILVPMELINLALDIGTIHKKEIKHHKYWSVNAKLTEFFTKKGLVKIRNAITTEKCESVIAPLLHKELARKPVIAMAWGIAHYGIKRLLENPNERHKILLKNKLNTFVREDFPGSVRFWLSKKGQPSRIEEFPKTIDIEKLKLEHQLKYPEKRKLFAKIFKFRREPKH